MRNSSRWAESQFQHAELGDIRRKRRLTMLAAEAASRPSGVVSRSCGSSASREGAYRWLESPGVRLDALREAIQRRTVEESRGNEKVVVALDGSSLSLKDALGRKGLGRVGAWTMNGQGIQTMSALAVRPDGETLGLCGQRTWIRETRTQKKVRRGAASTSNENRFWLELVKETTEAFERDAPKTKPWFQMDRGADCWAVLQQAVDLDACITVRAAQDRALAPSGKLWSRLEHATVRAKRRIEVSARPPQKRKKRVNGKQLTFKTAPRRARTAELVIRSAVVGLACSVSSKRRVVIPIHAVFVRESGSTRAGDRLEWLLLTTHPINTRADVLAVVDAYALRWRIEDFHRTWKRGLCRVEDTQLRSRDAICKWATILATVATRAMRLTQLARTTPSALATTELTRYELQALIAQRQPKGVTDDAIPGLTLGQAVRWLADVGGYTGPWNGQPGATTVGRGLHIVLVTARALEFRDKK